MRGCLDRCPSGGVSSGHRLGTRHRHGHLPDRRAEWSALESRRDREHGGLVGLPEVPGGTICRHATAGSLCGGGSAFFHF